MHIERVALDGVDAGRQSTPLRPTDLAPHLPMDLDRLVLSMIDRDPARRPSAAEVLQELGCIRAAGSGAG